MCIRRETREKARLSLAFSRVSKPHTHITHMLRQCTSIVYIFRILTVCSTIDENPKARTDRSNTICPQVGGV
jgi:hypothetical protein